MIQAVGFDLDDTLYEHAQYVAGAYRDVSAEVHQATGVDGQRFFECIFSSWRQLTSRCNHIFSDALRAYRVYSPQLEKQLVEIYRAHDPTLTLDDRLTVRLRSLRNVGLRLGLLTDGQIRVQERKLRSLGLNDLFDSRIYTGNWGPAFYKPHEKGFRELVTQLKVDAREAVYVGDNPLTDFETPKRMGFFTIRVQGAEYKSISSSKGAVDMTFPNVVEAIDWLLLNWKTMRDE